MIIGTAGHIDHGKTSLVQALTGVDTDRLKEEKARGISIDLGFAYLPAADGSILGFVDVPGHERFIHNMLAGATGIDFALLTIAADDGVMPQTIEHLSIIDLLGITRGVVALTKADLAEPPRREKVANDIRQLLATTGLAHAEVVPVSTVTGEGIEELREYLIEAARKHASHSAKGRFRLAVDRSFTLPGAGTVVTGTVLSGTVSNGDRVLISPPGLVARVRSIHAQNRAADKGVAGQRCALNLAGEHIAKDSIARGDVVLDPELHAPADRIDARLKVLAREPKSVTQWMPVRLHHAAAEVGARIVLLQEAIPPGAEGFVQLVLDHPIAAAAGDRFIIRDTSAQRTIGGGRFLDLRAPTRKRRAPERIAQLEAHALSDPGEALEELLGRLPFYVDLSAFARDRVLSSEEVEEIAGRIGLVRVPVRDFVVAFPPAAFMRLKRGLMAALEKFHGENPDLPGIGLEKLRLQLEPRVPAPEFSAVLQGLAKRGEVALDGAWIRLPKHEVKLTPADEKTWERVRALLSGNERFRPPRTRDIAGMLSMAEPEVRRLLKLVGRIGRVDEIAHDHFFLRGAVGEMVDVMIDLAAGIENAEFTAAQFRDRLDNGRKVAIQILEFFDRHGVTIRRGDLRRLNKHRLDLFRQSVAAEMPSAATSNSGREAPPVGRPDFKSGRGRESVLGGFDSHSLPPSSRSAR
jgi:selenocysteine-specific elongation factor